MKTRATKVASSSFELELSHDFMERAFINHPFELLGNKALKLESHFGDELPKFYQVHYIPYFDSLSNRDQKRIFYNILRNCSKRDLNLCLLSLALREDIPHCDRFYHATHIGDRKMVQTFIRYYPEYKDWDYIFDHSATQEHYFTRFSLQNLYLSSTSRYFHSTEFSLLLNFYILASNNNPPDIYNRLREVVNTAKPNSMYKTHEIAIRDISLLKVVFKLCKPGLIARKQDPTFLEDLIFFIVLLGSYTARKDSGYAKFIFEFVFDILDRDYRSLIEFLILLNKICQQDLTLMGLGLNQIFPIKTIRSHKKPLRAALLSYIQEHYSSIEKAKESLKFVRSSVFSWYDIKEREYILENLSNIYV